MTDPEHVDLSKLHPGPIRQESLPADVGKKLLEVYDALGEE